MFPNICQRTSQTLISNSPGGGGGGYNKSVRAEFLTGVLKQTCSSGIPRQLHSQWLDCMRRTDCPHLGPDDAGTLGHWHAHPETAPGCPHDTPEIASLMMLRILPFPV